MNKVIVVLNNGVSHLLNRYPVMAGTRLYNSIISQSSCPDCSTELTISVTPNAWRVSNPIEFDLDLLEKDVHYFETNLFDLIDRAPINTPTSVWDAYEGIPSRDRNLDQAMVFFGDAGILRLLDAPARAYYLTNGGVLIPKARTAELIQRLPEEKQALLRKDSVVATNYTELFGFDVMENGFERFHHPERAVLVNQIGVRRDVQRHNGGVVVNMCPVFDFEELVNMFADVAGIRGDDLERNRALIAYQLCTQPSGISPVRLMTVREYTEEVYQLTGNYQTNYRPYVKPQGGMVASPLQQLNPWNQAPLQGGQYPEMLKPQGW